MDLLVTEQEQEEQESHILGVRMSCVQGFKFRQKKMKKIEMCYVGLLNLR